MKEQIRPNVNSLLTASALVLMLGAGPAMAQSGFVSAYTDLDLEQCLLLEADDFGASWSCPGYKGYPLKVEEGDLRYSLQYGFNTDRNDAGNKTVSPFNRLGDKLEWRLSNASGRWFPIATIVRYYTADPVTGDEKGQVLAVTQLVDGNTCHIAYIDALANDDANELSRQAAENAGDFDCLADEPEVIGTFEAY